MSTRRTGSDRLALGVEPQILLCDEAGHITVSSLAISLTQSGNLRATILTGSNRQLSPMDPAKQGSPNFLPCRCSIRKNDISVVSRRNIIWHRRSFTQPSSLRESHIDTYLRLNNLENLREFNEGRLGRR